MVARGLYLYASLDNLGVLKHDRKKSFNGYSLYVSNMLNQSVAYLIDMEGHEIHRWESSIGEKHVWRHARLLPNGNLAVLKYRGTPGILIYDWFGRVVREHNLKTHHDFALSENGNILVNIGGKVSDKSLCLAKGRCRNPQLFELDEQGKVVWQWTLADHRSMITKLTGQEFPLEMLDWAHVNGIFILRDNLVGRRDPRFKKGNILLSARSLNTLFLIDKSTSEIVWSLKKGLVDGQHCPTQLDNGNLLLLDNA